MFKMLMGANKRSSASELFAIYNVPNMLVIQRKLVFSLYKRVLSSHNMLVATIVSGAHFNVSNLYNKWIRVLFK